MRFPCCVYSAIDNTHLVMSFGVIESKISTSVSVDLWLGWKKTNRHNKDTASRSRNVFKKNK